VIVEKDVAIQVRDGTVLCANVFRPSEDGSYAVVVRPSLLHGDHDLPKMSAGRMVCVSLLASANENMRSTGGRSLARLTARFIALNISREPT
jgi:predicted acyl esterase